MERGETVLLRYSASILNLGKRLQTPPLPWLNAGGRSGHGMGDGRLAPCFGSVRSMKYAIDLEQVIFLLFVIHARSCVHGRA